MKAVDLYLKSKLPADIAEHVGDLDAKGISRLMSLIEEKHPEQYSKLTQVIADIGRKASYRQGESVTLDDLRPVIELQAYLKPMRAEVAALKKRRLPKKEFEVQRNAIWNRYSEDIKQAVTKEALRRGNNLAYATASGARGSANQLRALLATPGIYTDHKDRVIPVFVEHSFAQGLRPTEYLAGAFGARKAVIATKVATAKGGDYAKMLAQLAADTVVTEKDCHTANGLIKPLEDPSLKGRVLARTTAGFEAGTVLDKHAIAELRKRHGKPIMVRSPMTCQASQGGVCAHCVGKFYSNRFPDVGDAVGITASQALSEPVTQGALSTKHEAGMSSARKDFSGFEVLNRFSQVPEGFADRAAVATVDGRVDKVEEAPQGGMYIYVNGERHYALPGYEAKVKVGDVVEAGDILSDGLANPMDIVEHKGIGEGRRYYAERLKKILDDSGHAADSRNVELVARAAVNHVRIDDPDGLGAYLPDDTVRYTDLQREYQPPEDTRGVAITDAKNMYLQAPAAHYTIGTRITPRVVSDLKQGGVEQVFASPKQPGFVPQMIRLRTASHHNPDWAASLHTSYLKGQLTDAAIRAADANFEENLHFAPRLAKGERFGEQVEQRGVF